MSSTESPTAGPTPETPPAPDNRFFTWMRSLSYRRQQGWIGGVAGGIAERLGIDPLIVRGILVVLAVFGAPVLLLYAAAWLLAPDTDNRIHLEDAIAGRFEAPLAGIATMVALSFIPAAPGLWFFPGLGSWGDWGGLGRGIWTLILIGALVWFLIWISQRGKPTVTTPGAPFATPEPPAPPTSALPEDVAAWRTSQAEWKAQHTTWRNHQASEATKEARARAREASQERVRAYNAERERSRPNHLVSFIVVGAAILVGAIVALAVGGGETFDVGVLRAALGSALAVLAVGVIAAGALGKRSGGPGGFAVPVIVALVLTSGVPISSNVSPVAAYRYEPHNTSESRTVDTIVTGGGSPILDLRDYYSSPATTGGLTEKEDRVILIMGGGSLRVIVPDDQHVVFRASMGGGRMTVEQSDFSHSGGPISHRENFIPEDFDDGDDFRRTLEVTITMGGGNLSVVSAATATEDEN